MSDDRQASPGPLPTPTVPSPALSPAGHLVIDLPDGAMHLPITQIRLKSGLMNVIAVRDLEPGETLTIPPGRWPVTLIGEDLRTVTTSRSEFRGHQMATRREDDEPATMTVVLPWEMIA